MLSDAECCDALACCNVDGHNSMAFAFVDAEFGDAIALCNVEHHQAKGVRIAHVVIG
jgi:hypothetical protein